MKFYLIIFLFVPNLIPSHATPPDSSTHHSQGHAAPVAQVHEKYFPTINANKLKNSWLSNFKLLFEEQSSVMQYLIDIYHLMPESDEYVKRKREFPYDDQFESLPIIRLQEYYDLLVDHVENMKTVFQEQCLGIRAALEDALERKPNLGEQIEKGLFSFVIPSIHKMETTLKSFITVRSTLKFESYHKQFDSFTKCFDEFDKKQEKANELLQRVANRYDDIWHGSIRRHLMEIIKFSYANQLENLNKNFLSTMLTIFTADRLNAGARESIQAIYALDQRKNEFDGIIKTQIISFPSGTNSHKLLVAIKDFYNEYIAIEKRLNDIIDKFLGELIPRREIFVESSTEYEYPIEVPSLDMIKTFETMRNTIIQIIDNSLALVTGFTTSGDFKKIIGAIKQMDNKVVISTAHLGGFQQMVSELRALNYQLSGLEQITDDLRKKIEDGRVEIRKLNDEFNGLKKWSENAKKQLVTESVYSYGNQYYELAAQRSKIEQCRSTLIATLDAQKGMMEEFDKITNIRINDHRIFNAHIRITPSLPKVNATDFVHNEPPKPSVIF